MLLPDLIIRSSAIHAAGCYTTRPIHKNTRICEYDGPRMTKEVADLRYAGRFVTYLFGYGENNMVIDGFGTAMFMNHSCAPNCETEDDDGHIYVTALRDIAAGEELVYEYNLYDSDSDDEEGTCHCGAPQCRGTMFSDLELARRTTIATKIAAKKARRASASSTVRLTVDSPLIARLFPPEAV